MNPVLNQILATETVTDGTVTLPLRDPIHPTGPVHIDAAEGKLLGEIIRAVDPVATLEIGMAYGVSTLYICDALSSLGHPVTHIVVDPFQSTHWRGIGLMNVRAAGYAPMIEFYEERSEFELPRLVASGRSVDFAFVDGWHTFDQVMVDFYYLDRMLRPGGVIAFDDADWRSVNRVIRYAMNYPNYEVYPVGASLPVSLLGRLRRAIGRLPGTERFLRRDLLHRDWDLGILGSCVALRKTREEPRSSRWYRDF
jgi:predicted O-methyltransferase YrrM